MSRAAIVEVRLKQTSAEWREGVPKLLWVQMDDEQKDAFIKNLLPSYMGRFADGVQLTPTLIAETVGATMHSIHKRVKRAKASQKPHDDTSSTSVLTERGGAGKRDTRRVLKKSTPEEIAEHVLSDPEIMDNIQEAILEAKSPDFRKKAKVAEDREKKARAENTNVRVVETFSLIGSMARSGRKILELIEEVQFEDEDKELLSEDYEKRVSYIHNLILSALHGEVDIDWDAEFAKITEALR